MLQPTTTHSDLRSGATPSAPADLSKLAWTRTQGEVQPTRGDGTVEGEREMAGRRAERKAIIIKGGGGGDSGEDGIQRFRSHFAHSTHSHCAGCCCFPSQPPRDGKKRKRRVFEWSGGGQATKLKYDQRIWGSLWGLCGISYCERAGGQRETGKTWTARSCRS